MGGVGIELAGMADLPQAVIVEGERIANRLSELHAKRDKESRSSKVTFRRKALLRVISCLLSETLTLIALCLLCYLFKLHTQLTQALDHSTLPEEDLLTYLAKLQHDIVELLGNTLE